MSPPLRDRPRCLLLCFVVSRPMGGAVRRCDYSARLRRCGRESAGAPLTSASRRHLQAPLAMASSHHASDAASRPDSHHRDCRRDQRPGCRSHTSCSAKNRNAGVGTRRDQDPWSRSQARSHHRTDRACIDRSRQDRAQGRLGRSDAVGLVVGRARALAGRRPGVLSLVQHARRGDGPGAIRRSGSSSISRARSSQSPAARSTKAGCCCRRWHAAPASISGSRPRSSMARRRS